MTAKRTWLKIVGIIVLILVILAGVTAAFVRRQISAGQRAFQSLMRDMVARCEAENLMSKDQLPVLQDLTDVANGTNISVFGVLLCAGVAMDALADEKVSDQELANMTLVRDFAKAQDGLVGFANCGQFFQEHPQVQAIFESMKGPQSVSFDMEKWRRPPAGGAHDTN
jgi:hypothetical protein